MTESEAGERLAKRLAHALPCSRSEAERYIEGGWVQVDGQTVETPGAHVGAAQAVRLLPGARAIDIPPATLLLHQGAGCTDAAALLLPGHFAAEVGGPPQRVLHKHFRHQQCVASLPAGASGLVVFTQEARITRRLHEDLLEHECIAHVEGQVTDAAVQRLCHGLALDGRLLPAIKVSRQSEQHLRFALKGIAPQQVGAMCAAVGLRLVGLKRLRIGRIALAGLLEGQWRFLQGWERF
ncbi:RNA pseudouridine synthase [Comamonas badia]|uniref:RNA pseudouridine synthase n=1 Tax=Comamonas badia TaxID=265291 RepID=UPI00040A4AA9|nr:RNA pseudouridine synthase [Comamonas badia]